MIRRFEMAYVAESYYGDELTLFMDDAGEGVYDPVVGCLRRRCQLLSTTNAIVFGAKHYCFRVKSLLFSNKKSIVCMFEGDKRRESSLE